IGLDLLKYFIAQLMPTNLFITSNHSLEASKSFSAEHILSEEALEQVTVIPVLGASDDHVSRYGLTLTQRVKLNASEQRSLMMASYFLRTGPDRWNPTLPLASRRPYKVSWSQVSVKFLHEQVPFSQTLYALNGTVVGLVVDKTHYHQPKCQDSFGMVPTHTPLVQNCLGVGLVRSIDPAEKCFYILTAVDAESLQEVNLLLRGSLECPLALIAQRGQGRIPYTTFGGAEGIGAVESKTRHLGRKKYVK
ncbi:Polynucleotide 5'-hydroxyl-kinase nol9, partial [Kappamyces sp. JEL0680]